jgi:hypothetical protein
MLRRRGAVLVPFLLTVSWIGLFAAGPGAVQASTPDPVSPTPTATTTYPLTASQFSLTVSPTRLVIGPDDVGSGQHFVIVNRGQAPVMVEVQKRNFVAAADGTMKFQDAAPYSASTWISFDPTSFVLAPGATQNVDVTVRVGSHPDAGDHQVALVFLVPAGKTTANISINRGIATPIYVTVPGPTDDTTGLSALTARQFVMRGPVAISATLHNMGTVHRDFRAASPLTLQAAGDTTAFPDFTVVRGADRDVTATWHPPFLCVCHATVSFTNPDGSTQSSAVRIIVFPLYLLAILLAAALLAVAGTRWRRRRFRVAVAAASAAAVHAADSEPDPPDAGDEGA